MKFPLDLLARSPLWAIRPEAIPLVIGEARFGFERSTETGQFEAARPSLRGSGPNKIAVVPIQGVLSKDGPAWYGSNYDTIGEAVESAAANSDVKHIVLAVDSPGGEVLGAPETGAIIANAAKVKPVSAIVEGQAASAAYWLASQARDIAVTPSGEVGSVGVRMMHMDVSRFLENAGVHMTELQSGAFKTEWSPFKPLSDEAKANMQPRLDAVHQEFLNAVSSARGARAGQAARESRFGEGRMFSAADAMGNGLVDRVQSSRDFYKAITPAQEATPAPTFPVRSELSTELARARLRVVRGDAADGNTLTVDGKQCALTDFAYRPTKHLKDAKLPIECTDHDETWEKDHIRNAISRWDQTEMPDAEEKKKARTRIKDAAKKHGIELSDNDLK